MGFKIKALICLFLVSLVIVLPCFFAEAKPSLSLSFYKDNGYGVGNDINGLWTVKADVSSDGAYVEFYIDGILQKNDTSAPFDWQFNTSNYTAGGHSIKVIAFNSLGDSETASVERNFQETSTEFVTGMIIVVVIAIVVASVGFALYRVRKSKL
jgi:hypothetical protein